MNNDEQTLIRGLFQRLADAERQAPPRDAEAERFIRDQIAGQPGAPYYMAQTIVVQEQALEAADQRIRELEDEVARGGRSSGGLFGGLFGGGSRPSPAPRNPSGMMPHGGRPGAPVGSSGAWNAGGRPGQGAAPQGGGFLAGAAQTAMGVAGGMMLGSMLGSMFAGDEANAAEMDPGAEDAGVDDGGGFDMGDEI